MAASCLKPQFCCSFSSWQALIFLTSRVGSEPKARAVPAVRKSVSHVLLVLGHGAYFEYHPTDHNWLLSVQL